jgi:hypothetical protein
MPPERPTSALRRARALHHQENVLLETAASFVATIMASRGFALAQPVSASFQTDTHGSTGIDLMVNLADAREVGAATAAIHQHFGADAGSVDAIRVT